MKFIRGEIPRVSGGEFAGANTAAHHRRSIDALLEPFSVDEPVLLELDFNAVRFATASYLKGFWLRYVLAGVRHFERDSAAGAPSRNLYPVLTGLNDETREEITVLARSEGVCAVEALQLSLGRIERAAVLGRLEPASREAVAALQQSGRSSAVALHADTDGSGGISATAWNNRLNELCRLRLATRAKSGRQWVYELLAREMTHG